MKKNNKLLNLNRNNHIISENIRTIKSTILINNLLKLNLINIRRDSLTNNKLINN